MRLVEEPVEMLGTPANPDVDVRSERAAELLQVGQGQAVGDATLELADGLSRNVRSMRQVRLTKVRPNAKGPQGEADPDRIHPGTIAGDASPPLIAASTIARPWITRKRAGPATALHARQPRGPCSTCSTAPSRATP